MKPKMKDKIEWIIILLIFVFFGFGSTLAIFTFWDIRSLTRSHNETVGLLNAVADASLEHEKKLVELNWIISNNSDYLSNVEDRVIFLEYILDSLKVNVEKLTSWKEKSKNILLMQSPKFKSGLVFYYRGETPNGPVFSFRGQTITEAEMDSIVYAQKK